jgi:hypothetical protein
VKRHALIRELVNAGCYLQRQTGRKAPVPRHQEIADSLCYLIKKQLGLI